MDNKEVHLMDKEVLTKYAYIYNVSSQLVPLEEDISFSNNDIIIDTITHTPGTAIISLGSSGYYAVWFDVQSMEPNMFTLLQNGTPIASITYEFATSSQQNPGLVMITASAGDILTLKNQTSSEAVTLQTMADGIQLFANASILIRKIR
jgi:hypothetical protein